jgi:cobalt-zinc-cadmium efflux system membrane fusion protein
MTSCSGEKNEDTRVPYRIPDSLMKTILIDTVKIENVTEAVKFNGIVDYNTDKVANIYPMISGVVQDVHVMPGDYVKAGQILGVIKSPEMANYNAALITAEANVRLNAKLLEQQRDLFKSGLASQIDITNAEVNYEQAIAAKVAAERVLKINGNNKNGDFYIKSPVDGFIVQKNITNGMAVRTDNGGNMFTISDLKDVWVQANVYEESISKVQEGDDASITTISYPDKIFKGKVAKLLNVLDPTNKVLKMRIVLNNPGFILKPQMFTTVTISNNQHRKAIAISSNDLVFDHSQYYVITLNGKKDVQIRPVEVMGINSKIAYIKSGLQPGEKLIGSQALLIYGSLNS